MKESSARVSKKRNNAILAEQKKEIKQRLQYYSMPTKRWKIGVCTMGKDYLEQKIQGSASCSFDRNNKNNYHVICNVYKTHNHDGSRCGQDGHN